jgi:short-subunit dehydrogenase
MITGASEGLGKAFAFELASKKFDLILIALPDTGLQFLASFIRKNFEIDVICFEFDLTNITNHIFLFDELSKKNINVQMLVNNAGIGNWSWFEDKNIMFYKKQIELNVLAPVLLTRLFLEQVNQNVSSYILNVGSLGGKFIVPKKQVYGATKSFISYFTKCLRIELRSTNTQVCLLSPGGINTKPELLVLNHALRGISKKTILEPEDVARVAIAGLLNGKKEIVPGIINKLLVVLDSLLPNFVKTQILKKQLKIIGHQKTA